MNLSKIAAGAELFAHCTLPLNIEKNYCYDTHFESGIGVAIHGEFEPGPAKLIKIGADLEHFVEEPVTIESNAYGDNLCRNQILVKSANPEALADYLLTSSLGNHHIIVPILYSQILPL